MTSEIFSINQIGELKEGTTILDILCAAQSNLEHHQFTNPSRENALSITKLEEAIMWYSKVAGDKK